MKKRTVKKSLAKKVTKKQVVKNRRAVSRIAVSPAQDIILNSIHRLLELAQAQLYDMFKIYVQSKIQMNLPATLEEFVTAWTNTLAKHGIDDQHLIEVLAPHQKEYLFESAKRLEMNRYESMGKIEKPLEKEATPEVQAYAEARAEARAEVYAEARAEIIAEARAEVIAEAYAEARAEARAEVIVEAREVRQAQLLSQARQAQIEFNPSKKSIEKEARRAKSAADKAVVTKPSGVEVQDDQAPKLNVEDFGLDAMDQEKPTAVSNSVFSDLDIL